MLNIIIAITILISTLLIIIYAFKKNYKFLAYSHILIIMTALLIITEESVFNFHLSDAVALPMITFSYLLILIHILLIPKYSQNKKQKEVATKNNKFIHYCILTLLFLSSFTYNIYQSVKHDKEVMDSYADGTLEGLASNNGYILRFLESYLEGTEKEFLLTSKKSLDTLLEVDKGVWKLKKDEYGIDNPIAYKRFFENARLAKQLDEKFYKKYGEKWEHIDLKKTKNK